jgi:putative endonuclease
MGRQPHLFGWQAEELACRRLEHQGYAILARRYRTRLGEIDIVAQDGPVLVFIEVKARSGDRCGHPAEAVTRWKQRRIVRMAELYLACQGLRDVRCRFDVVAIQWMAGCAPKVDIIRNAFDADR